MAAPVVLVTGCSVGGIGYSLCQEFAQRGCRVYAGVRRLSSAAGLKDLGVVLVHLEVRDDSSRQAAVASVLQAEGRIDILVNNAGISGETLSLADVHLNSIQQVMDVNFMAPVALCKLVLQPMAEQRKGLIINISSLAGSIPSPFHMGYGASKAALNSATNSLRLELEPLGIHVMYVSLGGVRTSIQAKSQAFLANYPTETSMYRHLKPLIAEAVARIHRTGMEPQTVARTLVAAALSRKPPGCLWTGTNATWARLLLCLPLGVIDTIIRVFWQHSRWNVVQPPRRAP